jgi:ABC-type amino acid transport substrate-binding protein
MNTKFLLVLATAFAVAGCTNAKTATEADFGNSAASLIKAQVADPTTMSNPSAEPVTGVDPDYADAVIKAMREDVSKPEEVQEPLAIRVLGQQGN